MQNLSQNASAQKLINLLTSAVQSLQSGDAAGAAGAAEQALELAPSNPDCLLVMATVCHNLDQPEDAERYYEASLRLKPDNPRALINLGMLQLNDGRGESALPHLTKATALDPEALDARHYLARAYAQCGRLRDAAEHFSAVERRMPQNAELLMGYGRVLMDLKRFPEAIGILQRVCEQQPENLDALSRIGAAHAALGDFDAAEALCREMLAVSPREAEAYTQLSGIRRLTAEDIVNLQEILETRGELSDEDYALLLTTMGLHLERNGEYERAFAAIDRANTLLDATSDYDGANVSEYFRELTQATVRDEAVNWPKGHESEKPVFIVGMPRSGTTLVEQILAAHPSVFAGDEQYTMRRDVAVLMSEDERYTPLVEALNSEQARELGEVYLGHLPAESEAFPRVTDKMPGNVELLPLIVRMFPRARIILCRRHPMDVVWSIYKHKFVRKINYSTSLKNICHQQMLTCAYMDHWMAEVPDRSLEVCYEMLTSDFETHARKIIDFVGLEWHDACLEPHTTKRAVTTASLWQVRQPVSQSSVGVWRNYEDKLSEATALLSGSISSYEAKLASA